MAKNPPAFQFYPRDFLADGNVSAMTLAETGAYIRLLCFCWSEGGIPQDEARLARMLNISLPAFRKLWPALAPCFDADGERWVQPRLAEERTKQIAFRERMAKHGKTGGRPKGEG